MDMDPRLIIDWTLELSVIGSFTRIGPAVRGGLFGWRDPAPGALAGRTALVTGPTSGLGRATAGGLAAAGARLVLVGRNEARLATVRDELRQETGADRYQTVVADLSSLASVRAAVDEISRTNERLDVAVDNAGAIFGERQLSVDGIEATLALLAVGPFALTSGLLPLLRSTSGSRVVAVTSGGMYTQAVPLDDLQYERGTYSGPRAYARAKRVQVALVREWARRLGAADPHVNAMHPGWADTPGISASLPGFYGLMRALLRSPAQGADTAIWLATSAAAAPARGQLFLDRRPRPFDRIPGTRLSAGERERLWSAVTQLAGIDDPVA